MEILSQSPNRLEPSQNAAIQRVCQQAAEPAQIWEALEAKGIEATPGMVFQAVNALHNQEPKQAELLGIPEGTPGLTASELEVMGKLVEKVGGVDHMIRILTVMQEAR